MIRITQGQANSIVVTLKEKSALALPIYLFEFIHEQSKESFYCIASDTSLYPNRYNRFNITEKNTPDTTNGEIALRLPGFYKYKIYEQESSTNQDPANANGMVEIGLCKVIGTEEIKVEFNSNPDTSIVYNG